jgi:site-specific DNA-methyltransferase (adenine-specific)
MIAQADCFRIPLPNKSVHCVVTSPPYWGLRKYAGYQGEEPLGLEATPERHIERTVQWAREVYRVLRDDGVFWLNYGDVFSGGGRGGSETAKQASNRGSRQADRGYLGIPPGSLMLMPHRIALALQNDGWIVRQDLVWAKPNPMPESVAGWRWNQISPPEFPDIDAGEIELRRGSWRHTRAHEYVFMLVKSMGYWADQEVVRQATSDNTHSRGVKRDPPIDHAEQGHADWVAYMDQDGEVAEAGRNPRSVLHIPTAQYKGAHYATFPPALITPLILATCPRWCCPVCGQGWAPVVEHSLSFESGSGKAGNPPNGKWAGSERLGTNDMRMGPTPHNNVLGHRPTCDHPHTQAEAVPGIICDPFDGSGTTLMVGKQLLRRAIGFDLSRPYLRDQALIRAGGVPSDQKFDELPLFAGKE